jgi:hypothetical protein
VYDAELMVVSIKSTIRLVVYYDFDELSIFDVNLKDLPWPSIDCGDDIFDYAEDTIVKDYPNTLINFPRIYAPELYRDYDWGTYVPFVNHTQGNRISETDLDPSNFIFKKYLRNEIRPFVYIKEIIRFIFDQIGYTVAGDFHSSTVIEKALMYHQNNIYYTNDAFNLTDDITLMLHSTSAVGYPPNHREYRQEIVINDYGTYTMGINLSYTIPDTNGGVMFMRILWDNKLVGGLGFTNEPGEHSENTEFQFHVEKNKAGGKLLIQAFCLDAVHSSIDADYKIEGTMRPLYHNNINVNQLFPDITVGEFITKYKDTFVLSSVFDTTNKVVYFDFYSSYINNQEPIDLSAYAERNVERKLNLNTGLRIEFNNGEKIYLDKSAKVVSDGLGFADESVALEPLPIIYNQPTSSGFGANVQDQDGTSILFYDSNQYGNPLASQGNVSFSRIGFISAYLRGWYYQQLNGEDYRQTINLPIHISLKLNTLSKIWIYDNEFMIKKINRTPINTLVERVDLDLFKIKSHPTFNIAVDESGDDDVIPQNPTVIITPSTNANGSINHQINYNATASNSPGGPAVFGIVFYANGSSDPNGLDLFYAWEVISSPGGGTSGTFVAQDSAHSITRFSNLGFVNVSGTYSIKLTVTNSEGGASTSTISLVVS